METDKKRDLNEKLLDGEYLDEEDEQELQKGCLSRRCAKLNNKTVLFLVFCMFACFATSEMIGALAGHSLALLGDACASCMDVITYLSNYYAETLATPKAPKRDLVSSQESGKANDSDILSIDRDPSKDERIRLIHEVYVPAFSVFTLVLVTIVILALAVTEIKTGGDESTNVMFMFIFASVNITVDVICLALFYYRKEDIMHNRFTSFTGEPEQRSPQPGQKTMFSNANLNMFAAFTHIGSDTLRTLAIYAAAIVARTTDYKSSLCDAWAAIVVSITILLAMLPLCREVYHAYLGTR